MNKNRAREHKKDFVHRLWASGVRDEAFIEQFYEGEEVEDSLKSADTFGPARYEEELEHLVNEAVKRYKLYWLARPSPGQGGDIQEGLRGGTCCMRTATPALSIGGQVPEAEARRNPSEVLTAEQLVARLAERTRNN